MMCSVVEIKNLEEYCIRYHSPESLESLDHLVKDRLKVVNITIDNDDDEDNDDEEEEENVHPLFRRRWGQADEDADNDIDKSPPLASKSHEGLIKMVQKTVATNPSVERQAEVSKVDPSALPRDSAAAASGGDKKAGNERVEEKEGKMTKEEMKSDILRIASDMRSGEGKGNGSTPHFFPSSSSGKSSTVLRTRVKSVVEMVTSSPPNDLDKRRRLVGQPSLAAVSATTAATTTMMTSALSVTEKTGASAAADTVVVPAKPPRLLLASNSPEHSVSSDRVDDRPPPNATQPLNFHRLGDSKRTPNCSLSLVDSSTSPYSSDTDDPVREYPGLVPPTYSRGDLWRPSPPGGNGSDLWRPSPPVGNDGHSRSDLWRPSPSVEDGDKNGGTGFNNGEKWSYLPGRNKFFQKKNLNHQIRYLFGFCEVLLVTWEQ